MGCVNISTKEFKYLAERNNLSINTLELLTHKYWLENKTEDYFPSDVYIQAQLGKIPYEESSKAVRDLWELKYKNPQEYTSSEALEEARREALKYFPEEAVTYHKNFKDNFVMVIRKPIAKLSLNISDLTGKNKHSDQEQADFDIILRSLSKELGKSIPIKTSEALAFSFPLKSEYVGKLIYAQSGTGKSIIADNVDVFDSDYLLGQILGVSTETAGFFFKTLSAEQKKVFEKQYRDLIRQKVAEGKTVLTANASMLEEADVVVYNKSAEQTEKRTNSSDRAINNRYSALDYHKETLDQINQLRQSESNKEYIELDENSYLADYLLSDSSTGRSADMDRLEDSVQRTAYGQLGRSASTPTNKQQIINSFLNEFGINVNTLESYNGELPLFDALNRVINAQSAEDITDGVGYAIAFMMQGDPEMQKIFVGSLGYEGDYKTKLKKIPGTKRDLTIGTVLKGLQQERDDVIKNVGKQIASELRQHFGEDISEITPNEDNKSIWSIIRKFILKLALKLFVKAPKQSKARNQADINLFVSDIIEALGRKDFSRIKGPRIKPGTTGLAQTVNVETALEDNPFEADIIKKLGDNGIALAGSPSIALAGELYRPSENPLHDIDFETPDNTTKEDLDSLLPKIFGKGKVAFVNSIKNDGLIGMLTGNKEKGNATITYVTFDRPFTTKVINNYTQEYYDEKGNLIGKRYYKGGVQLDVYGEVKGKLLDFFTGPNTESAHGFYKKQIGGKDYLIANSNIAFAAKVLWARPKDIWDYKNFRKYTPDQISLNELQMSIASPQTFTFKDGTTVKAPFKPNYQQVDALNAMDEFVKSDRTSMTLSGFAGTGKTSIMEMLAQKMKKNYKPVMFCASTNKAAAVLKEKVSEAGFDAQTLNKVFGITVEVDSSRSYNAKNLVNKLKDPNIAPGTTVIIDEASMINEVNYNILNKIAKEKGLKIIYVGDEAQLPPVNETKISKVFRDNKNEIKKLTIVERTDDNAILKEATNLRNGEQLSQESSFNDKGEGVAYIKHNNTNGIDAVINHFIPQLQIDPNSFRILAYTNAAVSNYNTKVRNLLGYNDPVPRVGEPIMGYSNWGYTWTKKNGGTYKFINSEAYTVKTVGEPITKSKSLPDGTSVSMQAVPITLENSLGELVRVDFMDIKNNEENRKAAFLLAKAKRDLHNKANKAGIYEAIALREEANKIEKFLFVNDNIGEKIGNEYITYQSKVFDFGYAMTTHKSQGSTFTHVLVDDVDISKARFDKNQTYASVFLEGIDNVVTDTSIQTGILGDIDLGIDEYDVTSASEQAQTTQINSEDTNLRQQLEYVAVSRATDTVTIISNNAKKEDSPLNHINEAPTNSPVGNSIAASPKPVEQISSQEMWRYMSAIQPLTKRSQVEYTPQGQKKQTYTVENGHIYNKEGEEIYPEGTVHKTHRNKIIANLAVKEGRAVVVTHPTSGENYVVDNNQQITSVKTGNIMQWDANNGDRRRILAQAEIAFRERIRVTKESGSAITQQLMDYLPLIGIDTHNREEMIQYLKEHGYDGVQEFISKKARTRFDLPFFFTPQGEIYGFATPKGNLYFDETVISPEHPIHEYTHLWDRVVAKNNPKLWKQGLTLMKKISLWQDIENDPNYGQKWKAMKGMTPQKLESLIASEVHARLVGVNGEQILNNLSKQKDAKSIIGKLKQWLLDFWKDLKATFSDWSEEDLNKLTLQDFTTMTVRDFADSFNPNAFSTNQNPVSGSTTVTPQTSFEYARNANGKPNYEVSSRGDKRFSAMTATFAPGTTLFGHDVSGRTIENVYQNGVKQGQWHVSVGNQKTGAPSSKEIIKGNTEDDSYYQGYLPLWQEWARQNPQLIEELRQKAQGKILTDMFASTAVSQARALADILNQTQQTSVPASYEGMITPDANTIFVFGSNPEGRHGAGAAKVAKDRFRAVYGQGEGLQGNAYALPTKDLRSKPLYSEDGGKTPIVMYRGYALKENREAYNIEETIGKTAVDYDDTLKGSLYFTSSKEEAEDYAKSRTDKSPEPPTQENPQGRPINRHYTGDYAKVSKYYISPDAKVEHYKDINDYRKNGTNSNADVIVLDKGTMWADNTEYIVKNPKVLVYDNMKRSISPEQITESIRKMYEVAKQNPTKQFKVAYTNGMNEATLNGYTGAEMIKMFKDAGPIPSNVIFNKEWTDHWNDDTFNAINQDNNGSNNNQINYGNDFRRVQEAIRGNSKEGEGLSSVSKRDIGQDARLRLAGVLRDELRSQHSTLLNRPRIDLTGKGNQFTIRKEVNPQLFHDIFEVTRFYTPNGELVDLHDDYSNCKCYLSEDGTCGFAIEPDGNLISVFSLGTTRGFLWAIKDFAITEGATHLDAFTSNKQNLRSIYEKVFGAKVASSMDYNMEYDHDNIAVNHGNPEVVFMVMGEAAEGKVTEKHFNENQYTEAQEYQQSFLKDSSIEDELIDTTGIFNTPSSSEVEVKDVMKPWRNDPSKENVSRRIYLKGHKDKGYFEVVKDFEQGCYSVHFKPEDSNNPNAFTKEEKEILFQAVADTIPEGGKLSTWGELSRGGIAGLNRFSKLGFEQTGERTVTMKDTGEEIVIPVYTKHPSTTQRISLPAYEYFNDLYEDTSVDAEWKIPLLEDLDRQLSTENTFEQNNNILKQMNKIMDATDQESYYGSLTKAESEKVDKKLSNFEKLSQQVNNLYDSNILSASEITHTAELIMNAVSDEVTRLQKEEGLVKKLFPSLETTLNFQNATRRQIIETVGIPRLLDRAKELFDIGVYDRDDIKLEQEAEVILDNWDAVISFGTKTFSMNEGFGIKMNYENNNYETTNGVHLGTDDYNGQQDIDSLRELEGDDQEHWQIEQRTLDILENATEQVRMAIHECYKMDRNGNPIMSKWGIKERVNPKEAITSILSWTQGALSLQDMINKLSQKQEKNRWLSQLISKLSDTTGNESTFQSQFFGVMCKSHQGYSIVMLENSKYAAIPVNNHPALSDIMETLVAKFRIKELPLFIHKGKEIINSDLLGSDKTTGKNNDFNLHQALTSLEIIRDSLNRGKELTGEMWEEAKDNILGVCKIIGYNVSEALLETVIDKGNTLSMTKSLGYIVNSLDKALEKQKENINNPKAAIYDPFKFKGENSIAGDIRNFLTPITNALDEIVPNVVYDDGKLYQAYVTPSYLTLLMEKFHWDDAKFNKFIQEEYGKSQWFKDKNGWRSDWIRRLATDPEARKIFAHTVELNFNKRRYMRNMSDADYTMSVLTHYWAEDAKKGESLVPAWFKMPMQSNKPSSEFIRFYSYRGSEYKTSIVEGIYDIFLQEISRIDTVRKRNCTKDDPNAIKNFDTNGRRFCFLPFLNNYLENSQADIAARTLLLNEDGTPSSNNSKLAKLIQKKAAAERSLTTEEESELMTLTKEAIRNHMENRTKDILSKWERDGIIEAAKNIKGIGTEKSIIMENLENFIWNDKFASMNILQLTIADLAAYKDAEDLQKRLAQLHAPGIRANIYATDFGNPEKGISAQRVSDGKYRTVILQDFDNFVSNIIDNISEVFDRKIAEAPENEKAPLRALKESLVGEKGEFRKINVADAQGYSSPSSYRKKALMFGKWSKKAEDIYQKLKNGEYNFSELKEAFQPLKPFVYTQLHKDMGVSTAPIKNMPIPFQAKNSEYLLIMADALLKGESLSRPNLLRAVYRVMEDSELLNPTKGIDTIQFESAIKSGLQGRINIHQFMNVPGGEEAAYTFMMNNIYLRDAEGNMTKEYNTQTFVHETSYDSYCLQQEVPEHFKEHSQSHGSQERMIIPSDLPFYKDPNGDLSDPKNIVYYEWTDPDGTKRKVNGKEFRREYEETIANNIYLSIEALREELKLNSGSRKLQNIALSEILQREILNSPRYGIDMFQACSIDKETGEFKIPKGDPIQAKRIEQLINSIIKNRINKQEIAGGPIVQVSNFGTSKQLNIRFKARSGGLLMLKSEFKPTAKYKTYDEYKKAEQAGVAYYEVFIPIWANELFSKFADKDGNIDITTLELIDPELLEMVSYRIPTEDKYSIAPMRVAGFMPKEAGDAIMFPYELTSVDDSDFDVDKRYVMRKDISIEARFMPKANESMTDAEKEYIKQNKKTLVNQLINSIKLRGKTTSEEREAIVKDAENKATMAKEAAKRAHLHRLDVIDNRNSQAEDAISNAKYSKDKEKDFEIYDKKADKLEKQYNKTVEKENQRYQIELDRIDADKDNTISKNITALENKKVRNKIEEFLTIDRFMSADSDDVLTREIRKAYLNYMFHTVQDTTGKTANNNKIISMTLAVLTTEQVAPQLLNPGGFAAPKKMGYMVEAFKNSDKKWSELEKLSTDELKKLSYKDKDLTWIDTQVQFYKQNAAAASLIGVFAVNKVAHATLESNGLRIAIDELCGEHSFTIAGTRFGNRMELDRRVDFLGNFIGKTLGSLVSASADAVKDPILNLMNINMTTAGMLNAMLRLGMPFNDAALFLSQNIITEVLKEFNRKNLSGYEPIGNIIEKKLIDYRKEHNITEDSNINTEDLTKEELIEGLKNTEHDETDYKVLVAFQKIKKIADAIRKPTFATRFNSISSAVGPLIIDNLILEHKMEQFTLGNSKSTNFYDAEGNPVEITNIFDEHPILAAFSEAVDIAKRLFMDMPTGSIGFRQLLNRLPSSIADRMYSDKKLLNDLSNFYQSYMLIETGLINPDQLKRYIENFPKWFVSQAFDKKYPDNVLIQNIRTTSSKKTDRTFLQINLTGEDETKKDEYRSAWIDLHKKNPELSQMLFNYFFFRAGIGFSPKTGMALVPSYVKERLKSNVASKEIFYLDVYRNMPAMEHKLDIIIDQFIRNNWNESKLVPKMNIKDTSYKVDLNQGILYVTEEKDLTDLKGIVYMRTRINNKTYLWKLLGEESDSTNADKRVYRLITPLGDNAEYIEMNTKDIDKPMSDTTLDIEDNDATELEKKSPLETDAEESKESNLSKQEQVRNLTDFSQGIMSFWDTKGVQYNNEKINRQLESMKKSPERFGDLITASFERLGIKLDKENAIKEFKKLC